MSGTVSKQPLYEQVFERLRTMIIQGVYKKGDLLPTEKQLIEQMQVSRITIREAIRLLNEAGIISTRQGYGSVVLLDSADLLRDAVAGNDYRRAFLNSTRARLLLEPAIAQEAARIATPEQIQALGECAKGEQKEENFHHALIAILDNPVLEQWLEESFLLESDFFTAKIVPPTRQESTSALIEGQHEKIYAAIRDHREEFAYLYMKEHLEFVLQIHQAYFDRFYAEPD